MRYTTVQIQQWSILQCIKGKYLLRCMACTNYHCTTFTFHLQFIQPHYSSVMKQLSIAAIAVYHKIHNRSYSPSPSPSPGFHLVGGGGDSGGSFLRKHLALVELSA